MGQNIQLTLAVKMLLNISLVKVESYLKFVKQKISTFIFCNFSGQIISNTYKLLFDSISALRKKNPMKKAYSQYSCGMLVYSAPCW